MTFLELVKRLRLEAGYTGTGPSTVTGQTGEYEQLVAWIVSAYIDIQNRHAWRWLRKEFTLTTTSGTDTYAPTDAEIDGTPVSRFTAWHLADVINPPKSHLQSEGLGSESRMTFLPWSHFRSIYRIGERVSGHPQFITVDPGNNLVLGPAPDATYVITGELDRSAQVLTNNDDVPEMPSDYHMLIVYRAMEDAGLYEDAPEVMSRSQIKGRRMMRQLEGSQMFMMRRAGPMA